MLQLGPGRKWVGEKMRRIRRCESWVCVVQIYCNKKVARIVPRNVRASTCGSGNFLIGPFVLPALLLVHLSHLIPDKNAPLNAPVSPRLRHSAFHASNPITRSLSRNFFYYYHELYWPGCPMVPLRTLLIDKVNMIEPRASLWKCFGQFWPVAVPPIGVVQTSFEQL